jgi:acetyl-CoA C-acetyltransferase
MTACIVGWAHGKFGKLDGETSRIADRPRRFRRAIADAGIAPATST